MPAVYELSIGLLIQSRDATDPKMRYSLMRDAFEVLDDHTKVANDANKDLLIMQSLLWKNGGHLVPFLVKSSLRHHMQQFRYLQNRTRQACHLAGAFRDGMIYQHGGCEEAERKFSRLADNYEKVLRLSGDRNVIVDGLDEKSRSIEELGLRTGNSRDERDENDCVFVEEPLLDLIKESIFRETHRSVAAVSASTIALGNILNTNSSKWVEHNREWLRNRRSGVLIIDDVFTAEGLEALQEYTLENTMWHTGKPSGYMCAFMENGFSSPLVAQTTFELQEALPEVFCDHRLSQVWGYKYPDGDLSDGIGRHSDYAAINVNCWTTAAESIEEGTGGMIVWPVKPPSSWEESGQYNGLTSIAAYFNPIDRRYEIRGNRTLKKLTEESNKFSDDFEKDRVKVPYRQNRCVIFNSAYIHTTDKVRFGVGYDTRRVNLTFLFGKKSGTCANAATWRQASTAAAALSTKEKLMDLSLSRQK